VPLAGSSWATAAVLVLATGTVLIGLGAGPLWRWSLAVGSELAARTPYIDAVLGAAP